MKVFPLIVLLAFVQQSSAASTCGDLITDAQTIGQMRDILRCLASENDKLKGEVSSLKSQVDSYGSKMSRAIIDNDGRIYVGGSCFRVRQIVRCSLPKGSGDHMTWIDNPDECAINRGVNEGQVNILAAC